MASDAHVSTPLIAFATASLAQKAFLAGRTFVHRLSDQTPFPMQPVNELCQRQSLCRTAPESEGSLAASWATISAAASERNGTAAHRTRPQLKLVIVTRSVTHGLAPHAPTAVANVGARASSRTT